MPEGAPFVSVLVAFADQLRGEGLAVGSGDVLTYCAAMAPLDPTDLLDLYWAGRTTMVTRRDQIPVYDRVFRRFFLDEGDALPEPLKLTIRAAAETQSVLQVPATEPGTDGPRRAGGPARPGRLGRGGAAEQGVRGLYARGAGRAAADHGADAAGSAAAADPSHVSRARRAACRIRAARCARRCACTASRRSCSGASAGCGCGR